MPNKKLSDKELMDILKIDLKTLNRFKQVRENAIREAKKMASRPKNKKIKVLGISGSAREQGDTSRESSNSEELLKRCLAYCKELGAETELIPLRDYEIKYCRACYSTTNTQCHFYCSCYPKGSPQGDDMTNVIYDKLVGADAIIFATPVNNFAASTLMKTFIDRCISMDGSLGPADPKDTKNKELNTRHMKFIELSADENVPGSGLLRRFLGKVAGIIITGHEEGAAMVISQLFMTLNHFGMLFPPFSNMYAMSSVCVSTHDDKKTVLASDCYDRQLKYLAKNVIGATNTEIKRKCTDWIYDYSEN